MRTPSTASTTPASSGCRARIAAPIISPWPCLEHDVERRLGGALHGGEATGGDDLAQPPLACLSAQRQPAVLRQRARRAHQRRERVVGPPDRVEVVLDAIA